MRCLDGFQELENQEIYFAPPDQLNDPLEGLMDVFWRGDAIVWANLFRHYLLCLVQATYISIHGGTLSADHCAKLAHLTIDDLPKAPIHHIYTTICSDYLKHDGPNLLIDFLSSATKTVRRNELIFLFRLQHALAIHSVMAAINRKGLEIFSPTENLTAILKKTSETIKQVLRAHSHIPAELSDAIFGFGGLAMSQLGLIHEYNNDIPNDRRSWLGVVRDFPDLYVNALERLIYPEWYAACFVANPTNASMWGAYGEGHRGVCLKFKTSPDAEGLPKLARLMQLFDEFAHGWAGFG
jgi:hypothetical protein